jgi:hypothetical protein
MFIKKNPGRGAAQEYYWRAHVIFPLEKGILGVYFLFARRNIHDYKYPPDTLMNFL